MTHKPSAAWLSDKQDRLLLTLQNESNVLAGEHVLCEFNFTELQTKFDWLWDTCQGNEDVDYIERVCNILNYIYRKKI